MEDNELTPHIEELKKVLGEKIDDRTLIDELHIYLNTYHLDIEEAKRGIVRKYGGSNAGFVTSNAVVKKIGELNGTETNVDVTAKVLYAEKKNVTIKGTARNIVSGLLGDETGTLSFTVWSGEAELSKGTVYKFKSCYTKKWNDRVQLNVGNKGSIEICEGVTIEVPERTITMNPTELKIKELKEGLGSVTVTGKILSVEERRITSKGENKIIFSGIMADDTGKIQYTAWKDFKLAVGDVIRVTNGYTRGWSGISQLNLGDKSEVSKVDDTFKTIELGKTSKRTVGELIRTGGGLDIEVTATVVDIKNGSGVIRRCPVCNRSILNDTCVTHGAVESLPDLRMKLFLDDGTGAISVIINRENTEKLTGLTLENAMDIAKARGPEYVMKELSDKIMMRKLTVCGNGLTDEYGPKMNIQSVHFAETNVKEEAQKLLRRVEAEL